MLTVLHKYNVVYKIAWLKTLTIATNMSHDKVIQVVYEIEYSDINL